MTHPGRSLAFATLALGLLVAAPLARAATASADEADVRSVIDRAGLLADPFAHTAAAGTFGELHVRQSLQSLGSDLSIAWGAPGRDGRPQEATVQIRGWLGGALEIRHRDERGRDQLVTKALRDSCARQVVLRRFATPDDPEAKRWRVSAVSALVLLTPNARATLPLVDLDTHVTSAGFLSTQSDLEQLQVVPQTCAISAPGDSVRVFVAGVEPGTRVCVFADGQSVAASSRDGSHFEARVSLQGGGLRHIGVTVYTQRTLTDASAPADTRTWVLPILVGSPPPVQQDWFSL